MTEQSKNTKSAAMLYNEYKKTLDAKMEEIRNLQAQVESMKLDAIAEAMRTFVETMNSYGVSKADSLAGLDNGGLIWNTQDIASATITTASQVEPNEAPISIPEKTQSNATEEHTDSIIPETKSAFDNPAFKEPYSPVAARNTKTEASVEAVQELKDSTATETEEEEDIPMKVLLNDSYEKNHPALAGKKKDLSMNMLLSGKPINQIQLMGNELAVGESYRQHYRISHIDGVIPTEMASGRTKVLIPA